MTLTIVWSAQARNQFVATLTYIAKEDPLSAEIVHQQVEKSLTLLCDSPEMGVSAPTAGVRTYAVPKSGHSFDYLSTGARSNPDSTLVQATAEACSC